jgi:hypothetical protein
MASGALKSSNYRKPPVEHQFKKGHSGNLKGRPKKERPPVSSVSGAGIYDRIAAMALYEATRPITVRDGSRTEKVPAIQAVIRSMFRSAAQGDTKAQRQLIELTTQAEADRAILALDYARAMGRYQKWAEENIAEHKRKGLEPPELYPHPDDIIFNESTGGVTVDGPLSKEQAGARKAIRMPMFLKAKRYFEIEGELKADPSNKKLRKELAEHKKYLNYLDKEGERTTRLEALKQWRDALKPHPLSGEGSVYLARSSNRKRAVTLDHGEKSKRQPSRRSQGEGTIPPPGRKAACRSDDKFPAS